jgi:hypothetical protein
MQDFIQKKGEEVSIVIYDAPLPPKYIRLTKRFIRTFFVVVPVLIVTLLFVFFSWGLGTRLKDTPAPNLPSIVGETESRISTLEAELRSLELSNKELINKLSQTPSASGTDEPYLISIKKPYGMQNLIAEKKISLDQFEFSKENKKISLKFQIISSNPETKVTGHILVFMIFNSGYLIYPGSANSSIEAGLKFSSGEPFAVSRLRPTKAEFITSLEGIPVKFVIFIFSREGDLLLIQETGNYQLGTNS